MAGGRYEGMRVPSAGVMENFRFPGASDGDDLPSPPAVERAELEDLRLVIARRAAASADFSRATSIGQSGILRQET